MITFFLKSDNTVIATQSERSLTIEDNAKLSWLYSGAVPTTEKRLDGTYVGPRREMITPWSTNAVEITQNMNISGITRIEQYARVADEDAEHDPMLQRIYKGLDQNIFTVDIRPEPIRYIEDLEAYNQSEGLALSEEEIAYLKAVEKENGRPLTDSEVFGFAQINSEHCRHKIFGGTFIIDGKEQPRSLFEMIKQTTREHPGRILSAYKDNVAFAEGPVVEQFAPQNHDVPDYYSTHDIDTVISLKAETHNFPTTVEPFNGASTGTGGEIRDRMGGGVGSCPIAGTAVYMTSYPRMRKDLPAWESAVGERCWLYQTPAQILVKASNGASDFGNKFGQPMVCGSLLTFEHAENGSLFAYDKVIMLAGGVGYARRRDCLKGTPAKGNSIVLMGGDNYRIGLGGGSVSSVETGRYSTGIELNAVQRANPEMQKRTYNVVRALSEEETNPVISIHDHGSAGHVNCLSELVEDCGGLIEMAQLPVGDKTLSSKEIIANESQERMGLLIDDAAIDRVSRIAGRERAPMYVVGTATGDGKFAFEQADGVRPFDLKVAQMFGSSPKTVMKDTTVRHTYAAVRYQDQDIESYIAQVMQLESVACKDWLTNKVDRSVSGRVARQQCQGVLQLPLSDCGVVALDYRGHKGIATSIGHAPQAGLIDARAGSVLSVAEALTNIALAPLSYGIEGISLSANWMWPCRAEQGEDARLYMAVEALSDFCRALKVNVPTGKDSLSMTQKYPDGRKVLSPGTVIVSAGSEVSDVRRVASPVLATDESSVLWLVDFSSCERKLGGSAFAQSLSTLGDEAPTVADAAYFSAAFSAVQDLVNGNLILAGHDVSAGGLVTTLLEMCFANVNGGMAICLDDTGETDIVKLLFAENPAMVLQIGSADVEKAREIFSSHGVSYINIGVPQAERKIAIKHGDRNIGLDIDKLRALWFAPSALLDERQCSANKATERCKNLGLQPLEYSFPAGFTGLLSSYNITPDRKEQSGIRMAVIREKGSNSEREMAYAFFLAGFDVKDVTMTDLISGRETLDDVNVIAFCGGFSNSDVLGSAKGWAGAFLFNPKAKEALDRFYGRDDTLSLGVCNGCQLMIELGLINHTHAVSNAADYAQMLHNDSHKFESEFVTLAIPANNSVMFSSLAGSKVGIWVAHGEGKFRLPKAETEYNIVAKYNHAGYPANPNGSDYNVAALCSADGRHLAIMPHPERTIFPWQCGYYPADRLHSDEMTPWLEAFVNARRWVERKKGKG
ncbi:MAG: phosphoribosylformylglycinamidine synthase [Prevotella sp.]|nr:phosphoribosylformylglycinamidine synthase [Prevotella sp.]